MKAISKELEDSPHLRQHYQPSSVSSPIVAIKKRGFDIASLVKDDTPRKKLRDDRFVSNYGLSPDLPSSSSALTSIAKITSDPRLLPVSSLAPSSTSLSLLSGNSLINSSSLFPSAFKPTKRSPKHNSDVHSQDYSGSLNVGPQPDPVHGNQLIPPVASTSTNGSMKSPPMPPSLIPFLPPSLAALSFPQTNWCAKCNATFRMTSDLVYHMRSHHKPSTSLDPVKKKREEKLRCNICGETFRERHHLTRHMTSHQ